MHDPGEANPGLTSHLAQGRGTAPEEDLIIGLARVVLERLEVIEQESSLQRVREMPESLVEEETRQLLMGFDGLKSRLKWIAGGM